MIAHFFYFLLILTALTNYGTSRSSRLVCKDFVPPRICRSLSKSIKLCSDRNKKGYAFDICRRTCHLCW
ncbi:hypothetical protein RB195_012819 [Necator americanus]|uniref:ShKT domain-containing protein n=1 Tax=Necator americanus TaxID=51031 RepID=A0ABR1DSY3_NECAM